MVGSLPSCDSGQAATPQKGDNRPSRPGCVGPRPPSPNGLLGLRRRPTPFRPRSRSARLSDPAVRRLLGPRPGPAMATTRASDEICASHIEAHLQAVRVARDGLLQANRLGDVLTTGRTRMGSRGPQSPAVSLRGSWRQRSSPVAVSVLRDTRGPRPGVSFLGSNTSPSSSSSGTRWLWGANSWGAAPARLVVGEPPEVTVNTCVERTAGGAPHPAHSRSSRGP
jgi:hypothetical protein